MKVQEKIMRSNEIVCILYTFQVFNSTSASVCKSLEQSNKAGFSEKAVYENPCVLFSQQYIIKSVHFKAYEDARKAK